MAWGLISAPDVINTLYLGENIHHCFLLCGVRCDHRVPQRLGELGRAGNHGIKDPKGACGSGLFVIFGLGL